MVRAEEASKNQRMVLPFKRLSKSYVILLLTSHRLELHLCDGGWGMESSELGILSSQVGLSENEVTQ